MQSTSNTDSFYAWLVDHLNRLGFEEIDLVAIADTDAGLLLDLAEFKSKTCEPSSDPTKLQIYRGNLTIYLSDGSILHYSWLTEYEHTGDVVYERSISHTIPWTQLQDMQRSRPKPVDTVSHIASVPHDYY